MSYSVKNLFQKRPDTIARGDVEDGVIVVRIRPRMGEEGTGSEVTRLHWKHHLYRPEHPLHDGILKLIAERMADLVNEAHEQGYSQAQQDIRRSLGLG